MKIKIAFVSLIAILVFIFFYFGLHQYANLDTLKAQQTTITEYNNTYPLYAALIFFTAYIVITGLSLPGAAIMSLAGGAVFGLLVGVLLVSFASTIGATLAFLISRYLFREALQKNLQNDYMLLIGGLKKMVHFIYSPYVWSQHFHFLSSTWSWD